MSGPSTSPRILSLLRPRLSEFFLFACLGYFFIFYAMQAMTMKGLNAALP